MKRNKRGISLIVLVITIIVMIILAGSVIISLSNSGIIGKANEAVDANNLKQVQQIAALAWSEAYIDKMEDETVDIEQRVIDALDENKVDRSKYVIDITDNGVSVVAKSTLGELITDPTVDYGKLVDYEANGVTEWQVFYEDEKNGYVFLISKDGIANIDISNGSTTSLTSEQANLYSIFKLGEEGYGLMFGYPNSDSVANLVATYDAYANKTANYKDYVIGAIGGPTIELFSAGYNAYHNSTKITPIVSGYEDYNEEGGYYNSVGAQGYFLNAEGTTVVGLIKDNIYSKEDMPYWIASPSAEGDYAIKVLVAETSCIIPYAYDQMIYDGENDSYYYPYVRPVVCLKSTIPAIATETGYSLLK